MVDLKFSKVKLTLDGKQVEMSLDQIRKKSEQTAAAMKGMTPDTKEWKEARKTLEALHAAEEDLVPTLERVNHYMKEMAHTATTDLGKATRELTKLRDAMPGDHKDLDKVNGFIEKFKDWMKQNRNLGVTFDKAKEQLRDFVNTPTEKLQQGLAAINKEMAQTTDPTKRDEYKGYARQYEAELATRQYGTAGSLPLQTMNDEQLKAEQQRLRSLYMSTQGAAGFEGISKDALDRLQKANQLIKDRAEAEREAVRAAKEADEEAQRRIEFAQQGQRTHQTLANMEKASYEDLEAALKHLQEQYKTYASGDVKHIQRNLAAQDQLKQRMKDMQSLLLTEQELSDRVNNKKKYSIIQLQQAYDQLKAKLSNLAIGETEAIEKTQKQMKSLQKEISKAKGELTGFAKLWNTAMKNIGAYMGVFAAAGFLKNKIQGIVKDNLALSDSMAQVQKVTGLTSKEIEQLNFNLAKLDTRTTLTQLNELAYSAGKMGLGKYRLEGVEGFVRAANQLQVALGEDLGASVDEAITPLAKLAENLGLIQKMGVEKSMMAIGSSINELSQTTTAAGKNIVDFARRIQPSAQMIGLTTDEILALGSASDSFGVSAEVSATAFTKFLAAYRTNTVEIERILNMVPGTLDKFFDEGRAIEGLMAIFQRMHEMGDLRYLEEAFKALGSEGSKMFLTFGAFSKNIDMFREHLITSNEAFAEAVSVTEEFNLVQATAEGIMERANNMWQNAFVNPEGVDTIKQLAEGWYNLTKQLTESTNWLTGIKNSLEMVAWVVSNLLKMLPELTKALFFFGIAKAIRYVTTEIHIMNAAMTTATTTAGKLNAFFRSNVWVLAVTAIALVGAKLYDMAKASKEAADSLDVLKEAEKEAEDESRKQRVELKKLYDATKDHTKSLEERKEALRKMVGDEKYNQYYKQLSNEKDLATAAAGAYRDLTEEIFRSAQARAYAHKIEELENKRMEKEDEKLKKEQWRDDNKKEYEKQKQQPNSDAINQMNRMESAGLPGSKMGYVVAKNTENALIKAYESNDSAIGQLDTDIKGIDADMEKLKDRIRSQNITPEPAGGGGGGGGGTGGNGNNKKDKTIKDKFDEQKKRVEGLIAKIDQWYNLQDATINDFAATGKITDDEAKKALEAMKIARNIALEKARLAVASGDGTDWKKFYEENMSKMMIDHGEWSTELFKQIGDVDVKTLHDFLATIKDPEVMAKLDASSFFDTMRKKAAESKKVVSETQAKAAEELNKMLLKYEYFDKAARQFASNLIQIGALGTTAEQMAQGMEGAPTAEQSIEAVKGMLAAMLRQGTSLYQVNPSDAKGVADMIRNTATQAMTEADYLAGKTNGEQAHWFDLFPAVKDWMENPEKHKQELENFYQVMLQAEQDYYQKRKQSYDHEKRQHDERFRAAGYTDQASQEQSAISNVGKMKDAGIGASFMEQQGLGSIANDPEVLAIQNLIKWRQLDVQSAKDRIAAMKAQHQQELADLQDKQAKELALRQAANATDEELEQLRLEHRQQVIDMEAEQNAKRMGAEDLLKEYKTNLLDQEMALATKVAQEFKKRVQTINSLTKPIQDGAKNIGQKFGEMIKGVENDSMTWADIWHSMAQVVGDSIIDMMAQYAQNMIMEKMMNQQSKQEAVSKASVDVAAGTASAAAKTVGQLGWWGLALIPVIAAVLHGLLAAAFSSNSDSNSKSTSAATKTKLVSGMLTYDKGNVERFAGRRLLYDDGTTQVYGRRRYIGQDGKVYTATEEPAPKDGLVTHPIATTVQGQPALVAENGPEIVIGRKTTKAIMMNEPQLIKYLADYGKTGGFAGGYRPFDSGNINGQSSMVNGQSSMVNGQSSMVNGQLSPDDARALVAAITTFSQTVADMQQKGIPCYINKYGRGGLIDEVRAGMKFMSKYEG